MKWLIQFKIASRQRLQPVSFNEYLHRVDAFDARYRVHERFELTILSEGASSLLLEILREVERCRRTVNARFQNSRSGRKANRLHIVRRPGDRLDGGVQDDVVEAFRSTFVGLTRANRNPHFG